MRVGDGPHPFQFITIFVIPQTAHHSCSTPGQPRANLTRLSGLASRISPSAPTMLPRTLHLRRLTRHQTSFRSTTSTRPLRAAFTGPSSPTRKSIAQENAPRLLSAADIPKLVPTLTISDAHRAGKLPFGPALALEILNDVSRHLNTAKTAGREIAQEICESKIPEF